MLNGANMRWVFIVLAAAGSFAPLGVSHGQELQRPRGAVTIVGCITDPSARAPLERLIVSAVAADQATEADSTGFFAMHTRHPLGDAFFRLFPGTSAQHAVWSRLEIPVAVRKFGVVVAPDVIIGGARDGAATDARDDPQRSHGRARAVALLEECHRQVGRVERAGAYMRLSPPIGPDSVLAPQRAALAGCFDVRASEWTGQFWEHLEPIFSPPTTIRLQLTRLESPFDSTYFQMEPRMAGFRESMSLPPSWSLVARDSLELYWGGDGLTGLRVALRVSGDSLVGTARAYQGMNGSVPTARVLVRSVACASPARAMELGREEYGSR